MCCWLVLSRWPLPWQEGLAPSQVIQLKLFFIMGHSKSGGIFGFVKGKVAGKSFYVISSSRSKSKRTEQGVRAIAESVSNPQTASQALQRMKLAPAQKFYNAFAELLSNAFQGVSYGDASRRYFMSKCMSANGPYIQRGVDRFIPAAYPFSEGSLPSVGIEPFDGGVSVITLAATTSAETVTNQVLAAALNVTTDYQITIVVVNNINGLFYPSYVGFDQRVKIVDIPEGALAKDANGHITISPTAFGLDASAIVAMCVVLSTQDASGNWLRSTQEMVISNELRVSLYGADAMEAAIYSYQDTQSVNGINSEWYYNLGLAQAWSGKLTTSYTHVGSGPDADVVMGVQQLNGRIVRTIFANSIEDEKTGLVILVIDGQITTREDATIEQFKALNGNGYEVELWQPAYAQQLGFITGAE